MDTAWMLYTTFNVNTHSILKLEIIALWSLHSAFHVALHRCELKKLYQQSNSKLSVSHKFTLAYFHLLTGKQGIITLSILIRCWHDCSQDEVAATCRSRTIWCREHIKWLTICIQLGSCEHMFVLNILVVSTAHGIEEKNTYDYLFIIKTR